MKFLIKIKQPHPRGVMRLGRYDIEMLPKEYDLNGEELAQLKTAGCQHWFDALPVEVEEKPKKSRKANE